jgi:hypothetical protein
LQARSAAELEQIRALLGELRSRQQPLATAASVSVASERKRASGLDGSGGGAVPRTSDYAAADGRRTGSVGTVEQDFTMTDVTHQSYGGGSVAAWDQDAASDEGEFN